MRQLLFVYGTLKRGLQNQHFLDEQKFVAEVKTLPHYRIYHFGWHPGMIEVSAQGLAVRGEIYEVDEQALSKMDEYEEVPTFFIRKPVLILGFENVDAYYFNREIPAGTPFSDHWPFEIPKS
ncbi:gamma-glutamylcyclotransferase [Telmatocola sphagniphila]|uniref:Gamma-glutamylcyclotransferase family protein n=1 Tax=Telmatocola sphagniphila TaxID=1123043 RepID=A0A8E6ETW7_9BACT|nr:gamma-glutamylcyclotransferase family protein [Telmatocola sphagniphila]QVL30640.1 gamma-glutamylcyclotransferase [Telmatocola sphagniphila]